MSAAPDPSLKDVMRELQALDQKMTRLRDDVMTGVHNAHQYAELAKVALEKELKLQEQLKEETKSAETFNRLIALQVLLWVFVLLLLFGWWTKLSRRTW